ncbi:MAG: segregation/condensation protein A [Clostridia bacterium]
MEEAILQLQLSIFNGPLDLLLHLVKEEKIEIKDIFVSQVTSQFLFFMSQLDTLDVDKASEYMDMAATLLEIKSRALLPKMPGYEEPFDAPEKILIRQLQEYNLFKEASEKLKTKEDVNHLFKDPSPEAETVRFSIKDISLNNLLDAFANIMHKFEVDRINKKTPREIKKDEFSVTERIIFIKQLLEENDSLIFSQIFEQGCEKLEIAVTFIALLELLKNQVISVEQNKLFDEIYIYKNKNFNGDIKYEESI